MINIVNYLNILHPDYRTIFCDSQAINYLSFFTVSWPSWLGSIRWHMIHVMVKHCYTASLLIYSNHCKVTPVYLTGGYYTRKGIVPFPFHARKLHARLTYNICDLQNVNFPVLVATSIVIHYYKLQMAKCTLVRANYRQKQSACMEYMQQMNFLQW